MAAGNTFGATALSSYGGFWISLAIVFTPGGFNIMSALEKAGGGTTDMFYDSLGLFLIVLSLPFFYHSIAFKVTDKRRAGSSSPSSSSFAR